MRYPLLFVAMLTTTACGRIDFDPAGPDTNTASGFGCGLRDLAVGASVSCAIDASGTLLCWGAGYAASPQAVALPAPVKRVAVGHDHVCALLETGKLRCFGQGEHGQLGDSLVISSSTPVTPVGDHTYIDVATPTLGAATCAVTSAGALECWGENNAWLAEVDQPTPLPVPGITNARHVFANQSNVCVDTTNDKRLCWGSVVLDEGRETSVPHEVMYTGLVGLGRNSACLLEDGNVRCLGRAVGGELGDGRLEAVDYTGTGTLLSNVVDVAGGGRIQCAIGRAGELWCWGANRSGELGTGDIGFRATPTRIALPPVGRIALGFAHSCAETEDGVYCWGNDSDGQLGRGVDGAVLAGVSIAGLPNTVVEVQLVSRAGVGCARTAAGDVWCWGQNSGGITGDPSRRVSVTASKIALPFAAQQMALGENYVARGCVRSTSAVACWGANRFGEFGSTPPLGIYATPVMIGVPAGTVTSLGVGAEGACVLVDGVPYCWGVVSGGATDPVPLAGAPTSTKLTVRISDSGHECALDTGGAVWCWGSNSYGELGRGTIGVTDPIPAVVPSGRTYTDVAATIGYRARTCAIPTGGLPEVDCWGYYDQVSSTAVTTHALAAVPVRLEAGGGTMCAVFADNTRECVGGGQLGLFANGNRDDYHETFQAVARVAEYAAFADRDACYVGAGVTECFGDPRHGTLGATPPQATPMRVALTCAP